MPCNRKMRIPPVGKVSKKELPMPRGRQVKPFGTFEKPRMRKPSVHKRF